VGPEYWWDFVWSHFRLAFSTTINKPTFISGQRTSVCLTSGLKKLGFRIRFKTIFKLFQ
jgi:hypothetical protein